MSDSAEEWRNTLNLFCNTAKSLSIGIDTNHSHSMTNENTDTWLGVNDSLDKLQREIFSVKRKPEFYSDLVNAFSIDGLRVVVAGLFLKGQEDIARQINLSCAALLHALSAACMQPHGQKSAHIHSESSVPVSNYPAKLIEAGFLHSLENELLLNTNEELSDTMELSLFTFSNCLYSSKDTDIVRKMLILEGAALACAKLVSTEIKEEEDPIEMKKQQLRRIHGARYFICLIENLRGTGLEMYEDLLNSSNGIEAMYKALRQTKPLLCSNPHSTYSTSAILQCGFFEQLGLHRQSYASDLLLTGVFSHISRLVGPGVSLSVCKAAINAMGSVFSWDSLLDNVNPSSKEGLALSNIRKAARNALEVVPDKEVIMIARQIDLCLEDIGIGYQPIMKEVRSMERRNWSFYVVIAIFILAMVAAYRFLTVTTKNPVEKEWMRKDW